MTVDYEGVSHSELARPGRAGVARRRHESATVSEVGYRGPQVCAGRRDHLPPARLLGPHRSRAPVARTTRRAAAPSACTPTATSSSSRSIKSLLDSGVSLQTARKAIDYLRATSATTSPRRSLVLDGSRVGARAQGEEIVDLLRQGQGVLNIVPLAGWSTSSTPSIHELAPRPVAEPAAALPTRRGAAPSEGG